MNAAATPNPLPLDVRAMHALTRLLLWAAVLGALGAAAAWVGRQPLFVLKGMTVVGDVTHYNAATLRANVLPKLQGSFFTLDLAQARAAFESLSWVRRAVVRREFPNRLRVQLQEHQPVAYWGDEGERLVNSFGEVFSANLGEVAQDDLPRLNGPEDRSAEVLAMWQALNPALSKLDLPVAVLELTQQGGWRAELDNGARMELGRGDPPTLLARLEPFRKTINQATAAVHRHPMHLASVDLRHSDGYAIRLEGVATDPDPKTRKN